LQDIINNILASFMEKNTNRRSICIIKNLVKTLIGNIIKNMTDKI